MVTIPYTALYVRIYVYISHILPLRKQEHRRAFGVMMRGVFRQRSPPPHYIVPNPALLLIPGSSNFCSGFRKGILRGPLFDSFPIHIWWVRSRRLLPRKIKKEKKGSYIGVCPPLFMFINSIVYI